MDTRSTPKPAEDAFPTKDVSTLGDGSILDWPKADSAFVSLVIPIASSAIRAACRRLAAGLFAPTVGLARRCRHTTRAAHTAAAAKRPLNSLHNSHDS